MSYLNVDPLPSLTLPDHPASPVGREESGQSFDSYLQQSQERAPASPPVAASAGNDARDEEHFDEDTASREAAPSESPKAAREESAADDRAPAHDESEPPPTETDEATAEEAVARTQPIPVPPSETNPVPAVKVAEIAGQAMEVAGEKPSKDSRNGSVPTEPSTRNRGPAAKPAIKATPETPVVTEAAPAVEAAATAEVIAPPVLDLSAANVAGAAAQAANSTGEAADTPRRPNGGRAAATSKLKIKAEAGDESEKSNAATAEMTPVAPQPVEGAGRKRAAARGAQDTNETKVAPETLPPTVAVAAALAAEPAAAQVLESDEQASTAPAGAAAIDALPPAGKDASARTAGNEAAASDAVAPRDGQSRQVDRARFVQRVAKAFEAMGDRTGAVRLKLQPPELGSLRMELTIRNGAISAQLEAETPAARNLLLENLSGLRDRLAQHDMRIDRFEVRLADRSADGSAGQWTQHSQQQSQQSPGKSTGGSAEKQPVGRFEPRAETEARAAVAESGRLNVII